MGGSPTGRFSFPPFLTKGNRPGIKKKEKRKKKGEKERKRRQDKIGRDLLYLHPNFTRTNTFSIVLVLRMILVEL